MKRKIIISIFMLSFLFLENGFTQSILTKKYIQYMKNANVTQSDFSGMNLPKIAGTWYYVDYADGNDSNDEYDGTTPAKAFKTVATAYDACTSGRGDGIVLLSRTISGTSYSNVATSRLVWSKYGITMIGIAAPNAYFGRARWTHSSAADSLVSLLYITGNNNTFINIHWSNNPENDGSPVSATAVVSAVQVAGVRNAFINCHFYCAAQSANAYKSDLELLANSDENRFVDCFFGSSSYDAGDNAACWISMKNAAAAGQRFFSHCTFLQQVSAGTAFGAIKSNGTTSMNGTDLYEDCNFLVWRANTHANICASWFIGTLPNTGAIGMRDCLTVGFTALDATGGNDLLWTNQPAGNAAGGIGVAP
jgi:hypothetical protein